MEIQIAIQINVNFQNIIIVQINYFKAMNHLALIFIVFILNLCMAQIDNTTTYKRNLQEIQTQCQLNQFLLGNNCYDCHYSCQQCVGNQFDNCSSCNVVTKRILIDNQCLCLASYYEQDQQAICQQCNKSCLTCQGGSENDCLSCNSNSILTENRCLCKQGYFYNQYNMECQQCNFTCEYCFNSSFDTCIKCMQESLRQLENMQCKCPLGYYSQVGVEKCQRCNEICNSCDSYNSCTSCKEDKVLVMNTCVCQTGYVQVQNGKINICQKCHAQCQSCFGILAYQCSSCMPNWTLQINNTCYCDDGYFLFNNDCLVCDANCLTCSYSSTNCLSCVFGYILQTNNKCCHFTNILLDNSCQCADEFYLDSNGICQNCPQNCLKCDENFDCQECVDKLQTGSQCNQSCLPVNCEECNQIGICTKCFPNYQTNLLGDCICQSQEFFLDLSNTICTKCSMQIDKCNLCDITGCLSCENGYFQQNGYCMNCMDNCKSCQTLIVCDICNDGYFGTSCDQCHESCKNCLGFLNIECRECKENTIQNNIQISLGSISIFSCECDYLFYHDSNFNCQPCNTKCNQCDGGSSLDCLDCFLSQKRVFLAKSCICDTANNFMDLGDDQCYEISCGYGCSDCQLVGIVYECQTCHVGQTYREDNPQQNCPCLSGYYEVNKKQCDQCPYQCGTCSLNVFNQPYCTTCSENRDLNDDCNCNIGYYQSSGQTCLKCSEKCLSCTSTGICIQCQQNFILNNGRCVCALKNFANKSICICSQGYYNHLETQKCLPCHPKCKQCELTSINCVICSDNHYNPPECKCASGLYEQDTMCLPCKNNCHLCKSDSICLDCSNTMILIKNQCECSSGYFNYPGNPICNSCSQNCSECKYHQDNCIKCKYNRVQPQLCICPQGTYEVDITQPCSICNTRCSSCEFDSNNCLKCSLNRINPPTCKCKIGYFENQEQECRKCNSKCTQCETSSDNCLNCKLNSAVPPNCDCLDGYFYDIENGCVKCHDKCLTCNGSDEYHCLSCDNLRFLQLQNTECQCQSNYYQKEDYCQICSIDVEVCQPLICGNGIKQRQEECDDGNFDNRDGCSRDCKLETDYFCQLIPNLLIHNSTSISKCTKCSEQCKHCNSNRCLQCHSGYFMTKSFECNKCDKHCKECSGPFQRDCLSCIKGIDYDLSQKCAFCEETLGLYTNGLHCASLCGDGIIKTDEKCDDGNNLNYDGCSNLCQIEQDWSCSQSNNSQSVCQKLNLSIASLQFQRVKDFYQSQRIGLIQFSKPMILLNSSLIGQWKQQIVNHTDHEDFEIQSTPNYNQNGHLESISILLTLHKSIDYIQYHINFSTYIIHDAIDNYPLKSSSLQTDLLKYKQLSTQTLTTTQASRQFGSTVLFILGGIAALGLLMGSLEFYWNVLDNLQILSYITYINVNFPYMHNQFLDIFQFARFEFTNDYFKIDIINGLDYQQNKDYPLIVQREIEYNLVINFSSILVLWATPLILLLISKFNLFIIHRLLITRFRVINKNQKVNSLKFLGYKVISFIHFISLKYCSSFQYTIILRIYLSSLYDLNFSIFTSAYCWLWNQTPTLVDQISFIIAMTLLLFQFVILFKLSDSLKVSSYQINSFSYEKSFGSLYEGIKSNKQINRQIQFIQPLRKIIFMGALLLFFDSAIYQISLLISIQIMSSFILIFLNPYLNILETIKGITQDVGLSLSLSLILFYFAQDQFQITDQDTIEKLSYIHVGIYTIMLSTSLIIDLYQQFKIITNKYKYIRQITQMCQKKQLEQNQESNRNLFIDLSQQNDIKLTNNQICFADLRIS
ncbi:unnamed protein product [Paramecium sonneborni]|uniref:EGF-like domain-containing protein n=1 Tax=Paramecium sonneborni TaxID=65129 RepID=A0A8S1L0T9_9CILI|nr:unnamed protein product [Paramecium sonneborni]